MKVLNIVLGKKSKGDESWQPGDFQALLILQCSKPVISAKEDSYGFAVMNSIASMNLKHPKE